MPIVVEAVKTPPAAARQELIPDQSALEISSLKSKLAGSEELRRTAAEDNETLRQRVASLEAELLKTRSRPNSTAAPVHAAPDSSKFEAALQTIGALQDKLEEAEEKISLLNSQLKKQILAEL